MEKITLNLPKMYADHHVMEVRHILLKIPGIKDVFASSSFQIVEIGYDPAEVKSEHFIAELTKAGYLGEVPIHLEPTTAASSEEGKLGPFRHTVLFEQTKQVVGFQQITSYIGRPLWPCPGMGAIKDMDEES